MQDYDHGCKVLCRERGPWSVCCGSLALDARTQYWLSIAEAQERGSCADESTQPRHAPGHSER
eukprot:12693422-Alexandrium_andersonii.AAC.1